SMVCPITLTPGRHHFRPVPPRQGRRVATGPRGAYTLLQGAGGPPGMGPANPPALNGGSTMRMVAALVLCLTLVVGFWGSTDAQEKGKEVTVKGKVTCAKCDYDTVKAALPDLAKPKGCQTVVVAKKDDKAIVYFFDTASHKKFHKAVCEEGKDGAVTG